MVKSNLITHSNASHNAPDHVQAVVIILEKNLFVRASELWNKTTIAAKDAGGRVKWVTLDPRYHAILVRTAIATVKANSPNVLIASIKEALFVYLLDIINGKPQQSFFMHLEGEKGITEEVLKRRQPDRKRNQASNRKDSGGAPPPAGPQPPLHTHAPNPSSLPHPDRDQNAANPVEEYPTAPIQAIPKPSTSTLIPTALNTGTPPMVRDTPASPEQVARLLEQKADSALELEFNIQEIEEFLGVEKKNSAAAKDRTVKTLPQMARRNPPRHTNK
jgi:hypothetical protein